MKIDIKWRRDGDIAIAALFGRIDSSNSNHFLAMAEQNIESGDRALLLDFGRVSFLSSAGLRVLLILARKFSGPGQAFALCSLNDINREVVEASGFDQVIPVHDTPKAAILALQSS